jgi:hypothetical protein
MTEHTDLQREPAGQIPVVKALTVTFCPLLNQNYDAIGQLFS